MTKRTFLKSLLAAPVASMSTLKAASTVLLPHADVHTSEIADLTKWRECYVVASCSDPNTTKLVVLVPDSKESLPQVMWVNGLLIPAHSESEDSSAMNWIVSDGEWPFVNAVFPSTGLENIPSYQITITVPTFLYNKEVMPSWEVQTPKVWALNHLS